MSVTPTPAATETVSVVDDRLAEVSLVTKLLRRPELGAAIGALAVFLFFAITAESFRTLSGVANWTDVASTLGIMAVVVSLLMIGGEFDLSGDVVKSIKGGEIQFAVDQQQYLQGYLPVQFLYLFKKNLNTVGGGQAVLTGPGFVTKDNAATVEQLAEDGTR